MKKGKLLIIDDNEELLMAFKLYLKPYFSLIDTLKTPNRLISQLQNKTYDVVLLDMNFNASVNSGNEGLYWLKQILDIDKNACVVLITAYGDVELAVKAMKQGAVDFVKKSWDEEKILATLLSAYRLRCSQNEVKNLKKKQQELNKQINSQGDIVESKSKMMRDVYHTVSKVATTTANVLITGENGTGKEIIAREIHRQSNRAQQIFVHVDLGAVATSLFESELFGHKKGAFTDAKEDRMGRFELASGGTLFLDEIGNVPLDLQAKLLTAIQHKQIIPVGENKPIDIDVRIITATNANLQQMVIDGTFREDLLYRLNTINIELPSLRNRLEDLELLANHFLQKYANRYNKKEMSLSAGALQKMKRYAWHGNIRELQHVMEKSVILSDQLQLSANDIIIGNNRPKQSVMPASFNLAENEKQLIARTLEYTSGNMSRTAKELGINRSTLYDKIKKYDL